MTRPEPPPEAVLLRLARKAAGIGTRDAAAAGGISKARLSQIENGYERRMGQYKSVHGKDSTVAHLAAFTGVTPEELDEAQRPDAAAVLRVILRRRKPDPPEPPLPPAPDPAPFTPAEERMAEKLAEKTKGKRHAT